MWSQAEYIRDGMNFRQWRDNMIRLIEQGSLDGLHVMCTINALSLDSLPELITMMVAWKEQYGRNFPNFTLNILRFPSFQSPVVLPQHIKQQAINKLKLQTEIFKQQLHDMELNQMHRLIHYLESVHSPHAGADSLEKLQNDFKQFYEQYDQRRNKNFNKTFSTEMVEWYGKL